jgi:hypothetical protein
MMNDLMSGFSWTMARPFYFETHDTMENVVRALETLEGEKSFGKIPDLITLSSTRDGYSFHYEVRRWDRYRRSSCRAFGDGEIWQHENGTVVVEGTAQINPRDFYGAMLASVVTCFVGAITTKTNLIVCVLLALGALAFILFIYTEDRNRVSERIAQVLQPDILPT